MTILSSSFRTFNVVFSSTMRFYCIPCIADFQRRWVGSLSILWYSMGFFFFNREVLNGNLMCKILEKHWGILSNSPRLSGIVGQSPKMVARRVKNLSDIWIHSEFVREPSSYWLLEYTRSKEMFPCNKCQISSFVDRTDTFLDTKRQMTTYEVKDLINCSTARVIYMFTCPSPRFI